MSVQVKSTRVQFESSDGRRIKLPSGYGCVHDPSGHKLPRCTVYFAPFSLTGRPAKMDLYDRKWFGADYKGVQAIVDVDASRWEPVARVTKVFYLRRGARAPFGFHHTFEVKNLELSKGRVGRSTVYKLELPYGCVVDDRGFVFP